jgi:hypothetical protein
MPRYEYIEVVDDNWSGTFALDLTAKGAEGWRVVAMDKCGENHRRALMERMVINADPLHIG